MKMFAKRDVLDAATPGYKLIKIDLSKLENPKLSDLIDLPTATKNLLKSKVPRENKKRQFRKENLGMLVVAIVKKL